MLGFAIFAVIILIIIVQTQYLMSVERTYCEGEVPVPGQQVSQAGPLNMKDAPDVLMLGAAWCPACKDATRFFVKNNINYCEYDMEKNAIGETQHSWIIWNDFLDRHNASSAVRSPIKSLTFSSFLGSTYRLTEPISSSIYEDRLLILLAEQIKKSGGEIRDRGLD